MTMDLEHAQNLIAHIEDMPNVLKERVIALGNISDGHLRHREDHFSDEALMALGITYLAARFVAKEEASKL